ncbi:hypothetical protein SLEP1_g17255 [Rubroshorea leprosula]|uniref:Uncharacterized protein n=1 Tax=Rubroshorea leprosula TaxID=152421 RepID=A0AAV5ITP8_9ROSI|nr:hypothetical protein SLEP1_g17255 [Rubroshorea leprosula]
MVENALSVIVVVVEIERIFPCTAKSWIYSALLLTVGCSCVGVIFDLFDFPLHYRRLPLACSFGFCLLNSGMMATSLRINSGSL